ncbi:MAG TPA: hypothetical protein VMJ10_18380 [Kofleriaceae bacterium]|nr:hypothetical protein [Kofleriaceae bacterium]
MRPGGLTALSIFNFVFGGLAGLVNLIGLATIGMLYDTMVEQSKHSGQEVPSKGLLIGLSVLAIVRAALLITSAIGYLGQRKFLGRVLGNAYAVLALGSIAFEISQAPQHITPFNLVEFVYPLITLFLLNVIFRKDLVR